MTDTWQAEIDAAGKTIDRMARQFVTMRKALEAIAKERPESLLDAQVTAQRAIDSCRKIDEELWR